MIRRIIAAMLALMLLSGVALADYKELSVGSRDSSGDWSVYSLQLKLSELGYLDTLADGIFGNGTAAAVEQFQRENGLEATGIADSETQELLFSMSAAQEQEAGEDPAATAEPEEEDKTGNDIFIVQHNLNIWGFLTEEPDGVMGKNTRSALSEFQKYTYDDMVEYTRARELAQMAEATPAPTATPAPADGMYEMAMVEDQAFAVIPDDGTLTDEWLHYILTVFEYDPGTAREGDKSDTVQHMQNRLLTLKYISGGNDGVFGAHSKVALEYFQQLNGLEETGELDEATAKKLFSGNAVESDKYVTMYKLMVSVDDQRVYVYKWTGSDYTALVHTFICSTGTVQNPTILGTFQAPGRNGEWYWMEDSRVWVKYAFVVEGGYFFHSVLFPTQESQPTSTSVKNLGTRASHGCIRLSVEDAEWIYNNCASGTTVVIYDD